MCSGVVQRGVRPGADQPGHAQESHRPRQLQDHGQNFRGDRCSFPVPDVNMDYD